MASYGQNTRNRGQAVIVRENVLGPAIADTGQWGTQDVGGITEGAYKDDLVNGGKVTILTKNGAINAAAVDHNTLANLTTGDPHILYALVAGRAAEDLTVQGSLIATQNGGGSSAGVRSVSINPAFELRDTDAAVDEKSWDFITNGGLLSFRAANDADSVFVSWLEVARTGTTIDSVAFPGGTIGASGAQQHTLPAVASDTFALIGAAQTLALKTLTTPTIGDFTNAGHDHSNAAGGAKLTNTALTSGVFAAITGIGTQAQALDMNSNAINNIADLFLDSGAVINFGAGNYTATHSAGLLTFSGDAKIAGDLFVQGTRTWLDSTSVLIADNHQYLNNGYTADPAQTGGLVVNFDPTTTADTIAAGGFTAGVDAASNPTVITVGSATFSASDFIQISGSTSNDGLYEVETHIGTTLKIRGIGTVGAVEDFSQNQFKTETGAGAITKIAVSVMRAGTDGVWETASGSSTGFTFDNVVGLAATQILTNKTFDLTDNTLTGTAAEFVTACSDDTFAFVSDNLSVFAATTSAQLLGVISDPTGTGLAVFGTSPTFTGTLAAAIIAATGAITGVGSITATSGSLRADGTSGTAVAFIEMDDGATVGVGAAGEVRMRSNAGTFEVSENGGAFATLGGGNKLGEAYNQGGAGAGAKIIADSGEVIITIDDGSLPTLDARTALVVANTSAVADGVEISIIGGVNGNLSLNFGDTANEDVASFSHNNFNNTFTFTVDVNRAIFVATGSLTNFNSGGADHDHQIQGDSLTHMIFTEGNAASENIALLAATLPNWQSMDRGMFFGDVTTAPTGNPTAGGFMYSSSGAGTWRHSGGTITEFGPAGPHCEVCGKDFWTVASVNMNWKSWCYICGSCGEKYEGGPLNVLEDLTRKQKTELIRKDSTWDDVKKIMGLVA